MPATVKWLKCDVIGSGQKGDPFRPSITITYKLDCIEKYEHEGYGVIYYPDKPPYEFCIVRIQIEENIKCDEEITLAEFEIILNNYPSLRERWEDEPFYPNKSVDPSETRYMRNDSHTINGLTAGNLGTSQTTTANYEQKSQAGNTTVYWAWDVIKREQGGNETVIGSKVAQVSRLNDGGGIQSNTWVCPQTSLVSTDAIRLSGFLKFGTGSWLSIGYDAADAWITEQLNASQLDNVTWTVYTYTWRDFASPILYARLHWGSSTYDTRIGDFSYTPGAILKEVTDTITFTDSVLRDKTFSIVDSIGLTDSMLSDKMFSITDVVSLADQILSDKTLSITDAISLVDQVLANKTLIVADSITLSELITVITAGILKEVLDSISLTDSIFANKTLSISDSISLTDQISRDKILSILDSIGLSDLILTNKTLSISDSFSLTDQILRDKTLSIVDVVSLFDQALVNKTLTITDAISLVDAVEKIMPFKGLVMALTLLKRVLELSKKERSLELSVKERELEVSCK